MDGIDSATIARGRALAKDAIEILKRHVRPLAEKAASLLDECGSEDEFRLRCAAAGEDPDEVFRPYADYARLLNGYSYYGLSPKFALSDWWRFEKVPGAVKPDPWLHGCLK